MDLSKLLAQVKDGSLSVDEAKAHLIQKGFHELGFAKIDMTREERTGIPEVVLGQGKTLDQVVSIARSMFENGQDILITRCSEPMIEAVKKAVPAVTVNQLAKTVSYKFNPKKMTESYICIVSAGTSDIPVAEEAAVTAEFLGNRVVKVFDVGVAGIHRLMNQIETIRGARVIIVIAGMEGALASVVGGLVAKPVLAVPTSIGYGANFGGIAALLSMLNSCASGVSVVNIDNGFGAACQASLINNLS